MDNFTVLSIPEISNERQIWLIRTNGGLYYNDFTTNKYVALGWDAVSVDLLLNSSISNDAKKEKINELYPDEKRPGLIFSQLYNFHCVMNNGDLVLIPSEGTKFIRVGILGETVEEVSHINNSNEEYADDDRIDFCFNIKDNAKSLTLSELNTVSDLSSSSPP